MKVREIIKLLEADGWYLLKGKRTSHRYLKHPTKPGKVCVPGNPGEDVPKGILSSVRKQAGL